MSKNSSAKCYQKTGCSLKKTAAAAVRIIHFEIPSHNFHFVSHNCDLFTFSFFIILTLHSLFFFSFYKWASKLHTLRQHLSHSVHTNCKSCFEKIKTWFERLKQKLQDGNGTILAVLVVMEKTRV